MVVDFNTPITVHGCVEFDGKLTLIIDPSNFQTISGRKSITIANFGCSNNTKFASVNIALSNSSTASDCVDVTNVRLS